MARCCWSAEQVIENQHFTVQLILFFRRDWVRLYRLLSQQSLTIKKQFSSKFFIVLNVNRQHTYYSWNIFTSSNYLHFNSEFNYLWSKKIKVQNSNSLPRNEWMSETTTKLISTELNRQWIFRLFAVVFSHYDVYGNFKLFKCKKYIFKIHRKFVYTENWFFSSFVREIFISGAAQFTEWLTRRGVPPSFTFISMTIPWRQSDDNLDNTT